MVRPGDLVKRLGGLLRRWPCFNLASGTRDSGLVAVFTPSFRREVCPGGEDNWEETEAARKGRRQWLKYFTPMSRHRVPISSFGVGSVIFREENPKLA